MSRTCAMNVKTVENISYYYRCQMKHHIARNDKVRFCLRLTPEQVQILQELVDSDFPKKGFVVKQKRKYLWVERVVPHQENDYEFFKRLGVYEEYGSSDAFWDSTI